MFYSYETNSVVWGILKGLIVTQLFKTFSVLMEPDVYRVYKSPIFELLNWFNSVHTFTPHSA